MECNPCSAFLRPHLDAWEKKYEGNENVHRHRKYKLVSMLLGLNSVKTFHSRGVKDMTWKIFMFFFSEKVISLKNKT